MAGGTETGGLTGANTRAFIFLTMQSQTIQFVHYTTCGRTHT